MKNTIKKLSILALSCLFYMTVAAQDPNFHIYLCFGQSNMQGKGKIEAVDTEQVPERFKMMAAVDFPTMGRTMGQWYTAVPPLCRPETGLGVTDYFGRQLVSHLPDSIRVGIIQVAVDGCSIQMFDEDVCQTYIKGQPSYMTNAAAAYDNNPFRRLMDLAKKAQQDGVIKGILIHQGETDMSDDTWGLQVHRIYHRMLNELGLKSTEVPLLAGEMVRANYGGVCADHIPAVRRLYKTIPGTMVASSEGCTAGDQYHFSSEGYRILGSRYADNMLKFLEGYKTTCDFDAISLRADEETLHLLPADDHKLHIYAKDAQGVEHDVTSACHIEIADADLVSFAGTTLSTGQRMGCTILTATLTDASGHQLTLQVPMEVAPFQFNKTFLSSIYLDGTVKETDGVISFKTTSAGGFGGWEFERGLDLTQTPYLMMEFSKKPSTAHKLYVCQKEDYKNNRFSQVLNSGTSQILDLRTLSDNQGHVLDVSDIHAICLCGTNLPLLYVKSISLSADGQTPVVSIFQNEDSSQYPLYDLLGRRTLAQKKGLYVQNGRVVVK